MGLGKTAQAIVALTRLKKKWDSKMRHVGPEGEGGIQKTALIFSYERKPYEYLNFSIESTKNSFY